MSERFTDNNSDDTRLEQMIADVLDESRPAVEFQQHLLAVTSPSMATRKLRIPAWAYATAAAVAIAALIAVVAISKSKQPKTDVARSEIPVPDGEQVQGGRQKVQPDGRSGEQTPGLREPTLISADYIKTLVSKLNGRIISEDAAQGLREMGNYDRTRAYRQRRRRPTEPP